MLSTIVSELTRSGRSTATRVATNPPRECPTRITGRRSADTIAASSASVARSSEKGPSSASPWPGSYTDPNLSVSRRSNYALRDAMLKLKPRYRGGPMFYADTVGLTNIVQRMRAFAKGYRGDSWVVAPRLEQLAATEKTFN